jgi:hypothetical protein
MINLTLIIVALAQGERINQRITPLTKTKL